MLVGVFGVEGVVDVPEGHVGALTAGDGTGRIDVAVLELVWHSVVVTVAKGVLQCKLALALVVGAEQVAVDEAGGQ